MNDKSQFDMVKEFHNTYNLPVRSTPQFAPTDERKLRMALLEEEFAEYKEAEAANDLVEVADALGDMLYIIYGTACSYGIPIDKIFNEIHKSNMSKLGDDGKPIYREDGKILKGPNFFKPNIRKILNVTE